VAILAKRIESRIIENGDEDRGGNLQSEVCRLARSSIDPAADVPSPHGDRTSDDHGAGTDGADAAGPVHAASADDGACFHRAQGDDASNQ
jgi:hypothetical protein